MDYTAVGQTTHLAARMEQLATPGTDPPHRRDAAAGRGLVDVRPLGPVPVKGLAEPVDVYELVGAGAARTRLQAASARGLSRFVGRDSEMVQLRRPPSRRGGAEARWSRWSASPASASRGCSTSSSNPTACTTGWCSRARRCPTARRPPICRWSTCSRATSRSPTATTCAPSGRRSTGTMLTLDETLKEFVPPLLWLLEALPEGDPFGALDPPQRRQRRWTRSGGSCCGRAGSSRCSWSSRTCTGSTARRRRFSTASSRALPTAAILLAVNYRPEYQHGWARKTYYRQLRIDPLPPESAEALLTTLLGEDPSVAPLRRLLIARTEGNPLFLEESVRALVETRTLVGERGDYRLAQAGGDDPGAGHRAGDPRGAHRSAPAGAEAAAPGGVGGRQGRAVRAAARDRRPATTTPCARASPSSRPRSSSTRSRCSRTSSTRSSTR